MKKNLMTLAVVSLVFASMLYVSAANSTTLKVNVPFAFTVGKTMLPAGEYIVEIQRTSTGAPLGSAVVIRTPDWKAQQLVGSRPVQDNNKRASLTFNKYDDTYFLASIDSYGLGCELSKSPAEKEIASKVHSVDAVSVAAQ